MNELVYFNTLVDAARWMRHCAALLVQSEAEVGKISTMLEQRANRIDVVTGVNTSCPAKTENQTQTAAAQVNVNEIMASIEGADLTGRTVVIRAGILEEPWASGDRRFKCKGGFGCTPYLTGSAVFGIYSDGEELRLNRTDIEGFAAIAL